MINRFYRWNFRKWRFRLWKRGIFLEDPCAGKYFKKTKKLTDYLPFSRERIYFFASNDSYICETSAKKHIKKQLLVGILAIGALTWLVWESSKGWGLFF